MIEREKVFGHHKLTVLVAAFGAYSSGTSTLRSN